MTLSTEERAVSPAEANTRLAAERNLLAWLRTSLAIMGLGFVVARFGLFLRTLAGTPVPNQSVSHSLLLGVALVGFAVGITALATVEYRRVIRLLDRGEGYRPPVWNLGVMVAAGLSILGLMLVLHLLTS